MNIIAQITSFFGIVANLIGIQLKNKKDILISFILVNILFGISFILLKSYSGAVICLIAAVQTVINFLFEIKGKKFPLYLIIIYILVSIIAGSLTYVTIIDLLPIACSILFTLSIVQTKEKNIRILILFNILLWTIYDLIVGAYVAGINDIALTISTFVAIIRYDILNIIKLKKLESFTINCSKEFLVKEVIDNKECKIVYSDIIEDTYWNFITDIKDYKSLKNNWLNYREYLVKYNRTPVIYMMPSSKIKYGSSLLPNNMKIISKETWMMLKKLKKNNYNFEFKIEKNTNINDFNKVFMESYSSTSEEDPYGVMPDYYKEAINRLKKEQEGYIRNFYVVYDGDKPIACSLTTEKGNIALIGFVGTIKEYRKKGICNNLMYKVIEDLKDKKNKTIFLQTEKGFIPEQIYKKLGFETIGEAIIASE